MSEYHWMIDEMTGDRTDSPSITNGTSTWAGTWYALPYVRVRYIRGTRLVQRWISGDLIDTENLNVGYRNYFYLTKIDSRAGLLQYCWFCQIWKLQVQAMAAARGMRLARTWVKITIGSCESSF
jgi:hypothetical protein